jgi:hypothetical protein
MLVVSKPNENQLKSGPVISKVVVVSVISILRAKYRSKGVVISTSPVMGTACASDGNKANIMSTAITVCGMRGVPYETSETLVANKSRFCVYTSTCDVRSYASR